MKKIGIIGGGASGMIAAISAAKSGAYVTIYEANERLGKKILATGNGRCNLTNINANIHNYHGKNRDFIKNTTDTFWVNETLDFFKSIGLITKTEADGKVYPYQGQASAVLDVLRYEIERLGIRIVSSFEVKDIVPQKNGYCLKSYDKRSENTDIIIMATGGKAMPSSGSKGVGYDILKHLGHTCTELIPSLVQIKTEPDLVKGLKGIKTDATVSFMDKTCFGEVLFTEYGLSGPPIFSLSPYIVRNKGYVELDIMPEFSFDEIYSLLKYQTTLCQTLENYFTGILNKRIGINILKRLNIVPLSRNSSELTDNELKKLAQSIKSLKFNVCGTLSWNNAQVTAGGINTDEINDKTFESKKLKNLYVIGELLDIDGDCGGYNLQWAWSSGFIAGRAAAQNI